MDQHTGIWNVGIALVRATVGVMLILHGRELFEAHDPNVIPDLLFNMNIPFSDAMAYTGKVIEFTGGILMTLGLFTRFVTSLFFLMFMFITFVERQGNILTENQPSFLLALIFLMFFFTGPGRLSFDFILMIKRKERNGDTGKEEESRFGRYVSKK